MEIDPLFKKRIVEGLYGIGAIKIGSFKLKSGDMSPFYIDLRLVPSYPKVFAMVNEAYARKFEDIFGKKRDLLIGGIMSAGIPFATALCLKYGLPLLQIRSEPKKHGTGKLIEGKELTKGDEVLLVDDLISTGASKIKPKQAIEEGGGKVNHLLVLIDRTSETTKFVVEESGMQLHSVLNLADMVEILKDSNQISKEEFNSIKSAVTDWV
ncbi:MAG: orotate phosphoribosyltransferase [Methanobacteriota archaeon]|nr:MAG: orotate phosphoribosyltransferase [Euryarchaeota archaeon]